MKGQTTWSYAPYKPFLFDSGDIYVCRIAPGKDYIHAEWLGDADASYEVWIREENAGEFEKAAVVKDTEVTLAGLKEYQDYEFFVQCGEKKSRIRLARTGEAVGTVVNYLHPRDAAYSFSGRYLCSPSMVRLPGGALLTSMDLFAGNAPQNLTLIFRSDDNGETWHYVSELFPCFWGKLFVHRGELYMISCSTEYGDLLIGKSTDEGKTFCVPTVILRGACKCNMPGVHKNPQPVIEYKGRIYNTCEWGAWAQRFHAPMVISADAGSDLLDAASWHITPPVMYDPSWKGVAEGPSTGNIEGTLAVAPDGELYNIMRYDMSKTVPDRGLVLAYRVNTDAPDAPLEYSHSIKLMGNHSKFTIHKDDVSGLYFTIICRIDETGAVSDRRRISLMSSPDLENWSLVTDLIDHRHESRQEVGFQYVDFQFDGDDLIYLCRTAMNQAANFHDANYQTFHRLKNFRSLVK